MIEEIKDGFSFLAIHYPFYRKDAIRVEVDAHPVEEYRKYIQKNGIESAYIIMPDLEILKDCPSLKYLRIGPSYNASPDFDFSPLYQHPEIQSLVCQNIYGNQMQYLSSIDFSRIPGLIDLGVLVNKGTLNYNKIQTLKSLDVGGFQGRNRDLTDLFCSRELDTLRMIQCGVHSLAGIDTSEKMQCLYLDYNRSLKDISALRKVKHTLRALRIENCPKIEDFSVLGELENLELLELSGRNALPSLDFLKSMKRLSLFVFDMNVLDGDLSPCLEISHAESRRNRKHYNLKNQDLPKGRFKMGNEDIDEWRKLE